MKSTIFTLLVFSSLFLFSCQKEISNELGGSNNNGGNNNSSSGDLLVKTVAKEGSDSLVTTYEYDASKRLIRQKILGRSSGQDIDNDLKIIRNGSGIVTMLIQKNAQFIAQGLDSVITIVNYNATTQKYTSRVMEIGLLGFSATDSAVISYDANGRQSLEEHYLGSPSLGLPMDIQSKFEFIRNPDGSMQQNNLYSADPSTGNLGLISTIKYTYDTKVSPLILSANDAAAVGMPDVTAPSNATKIDFQDLSGGPGSFILTLTYTYNSSNKPATSVQTKGSVTTNTTYYYQ